jgi:hypothetical protein
VLLLVSSKMMRESTGSITSSCECGNRSLSESQDSHFLNKQDTRATIKVLIKDMPILSLLF